MRNAQRNATYAKPRMHAPRQQNPLLLLAAGYLLLTVCSQVSPAQGFPKVSPASTVAASETATVTTTNVTVAADSQFDDDSCPPCDLIFSKVLDYGQGVRRQYVDLMERGEPKSGTGFMFEWAGGCLEHACDYFKEMFGESSCTVRGAGWGSKGLGGVYCGGGLDEDIDKGRLEGSKAVTTVTKSIYIVCGKRAKNGMDFYFFVNS